MVQMQAIMTQLIFEHALRIRVKNTPAAPGKAGMPSAGKKKKANGSLEGRLNNLISSDLNAVTSARDFTLWFVYGPLQVILCFVFLYAILGWRLVDIMQRIVLRSYLGLLTSPLSSSLVGIAILMVGMLVPGSIAKRQHVIQVNRMKAVCLLRS